MNVIDFGIGRVAKPTAGQSLAFILTLAAAGLWQAAPAAAAARGGSASSRSRSYSAGMSRASSHGVVMRHSGGYGSGRAFSSAAVRGAERRQPRPGIRSYGYAYRYRPYFRPHFRTYYRPRFYGSVYFELGGPDWYYPYSYGGYAYPAYPYSSYSPYYCDGCSAGDPSPAISTGDAPPEGEAPAIPTGSGRLQLEVTPGDAVVYVDGRFEGTGREVTVLDLSPGSHVIEVVRPGYRAQTRRITIQKEETRDLTVDLQRP